MRDGHPEMGSSPLTRGKRLFLSPPAGVPGLIPAHAGKTEMGGIEPPAGWAHPRSRGENLWSPSLRVGGLGSSPLTRGKPAQEGTNLQTVRLIPAHAGKTARRKRSD